MLLVYLVSGVDETKEHAVGIQAAEQVLRPRGEAESVLAHTASILENEQLFKLLNDAYFDIREHPPGTPIVFIIDAHGSEEGVSIGSNPNIKWSDLTGYFRQINRYSKMNLILILGSCHGAYGLKMIEPGEPAPFLCLFGPKSKINSQILQYFYRDFFTIMLNEKNLTNTLKSLMDQYREFIYFSTASGMLKEAYKQYYGNKNKLNLLIHRLKLRKKIIKSTHIPANLKIEKLELLKNDKIFNKTMFDDFTSKFFMFDEIPENRERYAYFSFESIAEDK